MYSNVPGLKVISPWNARDARGLLKASIRDNDPVVFLENEMMYGVEFDLSAEEMDKDYCLPLGKCHIERAGTDVTVTAHAKMVGVSLEAAEVLQRDHGISCEVINLELFAPWTGKQSLIPSRRPTEL